MRPNNSKSRSERALRPAELQRLIGIVQKFAGHENEVGIADVLEVVEKAFKPSVTSGFDAASAVERRLVLRLEACYAGVAVLSRSTPGSCSSKAKL